MSVRRQIIYDAVTQQMTGFVGLGDGCNDESEATEVLVFMPVGLTGHWKAPVACYLTRSLSAGVQTRLIRDLLVALHDVDIRVCYITMDGHATNVRICSKLGCQLTIGNGPTKPTKPFFTHPTSNQNQNQSESEMFIRSVDPGTPAKSGRCRRGHQNNYMMIQYKSG